MLRACACAGIHKSRGTKFCTVKPNICGSSVWNMPYNTLAAPAIWSGSSMFGEFVYPCLHVYVAKAVWLPVAVSLKTCISEVPGSNLGRPLAVLTGLSWFLSASFGQMPAYRIDYAETAYRRQRVRASAKKMFTPCHPTKADRLKIFTLNQKVCQLQSGLGLVPDSVTTTRKLQNCVIHRRYIYEMTALGRSAYRILKPCIRWLTLSIVCSNSSRWMPERCQNYKKTPNIWDVQSKFVTEEEGIAITKLTQNN
jgi:hypothetical protein